LQGENMELLSVLEEFKVKEGIKKEKSESKRLELKYKKLSVCGKAGSVKSYIAPKWMKGKCEIGMESKSMSKSLTKKRLRKPNFLLDKSVVNVG